MDPRADALLLRIVDGALEESARRAGPWMACRVGCTECCIGPFPVNMLDAWRLGQGMRQLERLDPDRASAVRERAARAVAAMSADFPGNPETGLLDGDDAAEEAFATRHAGLPCPVLDPATGACDLYRFRPLSCRTYGPPVAIGGEGLPPCPLCFAGASVDLLEACRAAIDPDGVEDAILSQMETGGAPAAQTVVAFTLLRTPGTPPGENGHTR